MKVIIVAGLFGGLEKRYYAPLAQIFGQEKFEILRAGADWNPEIIAEKIRQIDDDKVIICISLGAIVGNMLANEKRTRIYYICPFLGNEFNRREYPRKFRLFFKGLAAACMAITWPFKWHRWYPLFGGTRPDGHFLSIFAVFQQLWWAFRKMPEIKQVSGVIYSEGDATVDPDVIRALYPNAIAARRADGGNPNHANFREEGREFGKPSSSSSSSSREIGEDAKAYTSALLAATKKGPL